MTSDAEQSRKHLRNLLGYAEEILKSGERVVADLATDAVVSFHEHSVAQLDGVSSPKDADEGWLRVARLRENPPPSPNDAYLPWLDRPGRGAGSLQPPTLSPTLLVAATPEEASDLEEAGLALPEDVMRPVGDDAGTRGTVDVLLRLENLLEFDAAFRNWLAGPWAAWERVERPRRQSIAFYNRLFEIQQRASSMGDDTPVETVFGVGLARWRHADRRIDAPLVEAAVDLELREDGAIVVVPKPQPPRVALRAFDALELPGIGRLQQEAQAQLERSYEDPDVGFSPHTKAAFEPVLRMCHARLASDAVYEPDFREPGDRAPPVADGKLRITDGWVLYARQRSANFRCDDIRRLKAAVDAAENDGLPAPGIQMTKRPSDERTEEGFVDLDGTTWHLPDGPEITGGTTDTKRGGAAGATDADPIYFFPLPSNDDQVEVVRRLERPETSGVVVQGPPGTGKTHTIANIVAHYMARGRRVLVSAHQPEALAAIQGKLPESIRDLAISVVRSDRDGARRLEQAIDILASEVKSIDVRAYDSRRIDLEGELARAALELERLDGAIRSHAESNLAVVEFRGQKLSAMELAERVLAERGEHAWFSDELTPDVRHEPRFGDAEIAEARRLRDELGRDVVYAVGEFPDPSALPDVPHVLAAHAALAGERRAAEMAALGDLPYVSWESDTTFEQARELLNWLKDVAAWKRDVEAIAPWLADAWRMVLGATPAHESVRGAVTELCLDWSTLCRQGRTFIVRGIVVPDPGEHAAGFDNAVAACAEGRKPFGLFAFGSAPKKIKELLDGVCIDGDVPGDQAAWACVRESRAWRARARTFAGRWRSAAATAGFPSAMADAAIAAEEVLRLGDCVERMCGLQRDVEGHVARLGALFPYGLDARKVTCGLEVAPAIASLSAALNKEDNAEAHRLVRVLADIGAATERPFHGAVANLAASLGREGLSERDLAGAWARIREEAQRLAALHPRRARLDEIAASVAASGALRWAAAISSSGGPEHLDPGDWRRAWEWARAAGHVRGLADRHALEALSVRRAAVEDRRRALLAELVRVRTFIGLKQNITEKVASALQKFAVAVRLLGGGTGKSAERHRRAIRQAALDAASAVPCWILPEWRVAEQLPPDLGAFDLVIIDEASQSDITSLPAVLRGKKLLVVGDDKQVSPSAVGMEIRTIVQLRETFLRGMDIANFLEPTTSLYDLASMTFPGSVIMLREHFRCVEPIIAFSSRFYPKALVPLRVPTADERIDPPLVDVYVRNGRKLRDVNQAEADYVVAEISALVAAPAYARRTIGVISLIGDKQAKRIQDMLVDAVGTEAIARHRIMCGNASTFQGQERDVMFLTMVACPLTARSQTARLIEQRLNVAMSRARDRMYLVRSVAASELGANDLKAAVIEHFRVPMARAVVPGDPEILDETESPFEREVGGLLLARGFRLRPQVRVGGFRIDFVVEGEGDRRLAVELDGDRYHGPERWFEDMRRQRALERIGWIFWRCWGSHWLADPSGCLDDLLGTLSRLGIEPVGGELGPQIWTERRIIDDNGQTTTTLDSKPATIASVPTDLEPPLQLSNDSSTADVTPPPASSGGGDIVEFGDTVIVRFADDNRVRRFRLNSGEHDPSRGEIGAAQPIARVLLGTGVEEEVEMNVDGSIRRVIVEKITKAA